MSTRNYLKEAAELSSVAAKLTNDQKQQITALEKKADKAAANLELALRLITKDLKEEVIRSSDAKIARAVAEANTEDVLSEIHAKIREINPSFVSNAKERVEDISIKLAYNAVEFSEKAALGLGSIVRPFLKSMRKGWSEARDEVRGLEE